MDKKMMAQTVLEGFFVKRQHDHGNTYKEKIKLWWLNYGFRGSGHYHHDREHGSVQVHMVLDT